MIESTTGLSLYRIQAVSLFLTEVSIFLFVLTVEVFNLGVANFIISSHSSLFIKFFMTTGFLYLGIMINKSITTKINNKMNFVIY